jgi:hypothetical protein
MAFPIIQSTSSGKIETSNNYTFPITLPSGITTGDLLVCFVSNAYPATGCKTQEVYPTWGRMTIVSDRSHWGTLSVFVKYATSGSETLTVYSCSLDSRLRIVSGYKYTKIAYVCYRISGGYISNGYDYSPLSTHGSNWDLNPCPLLTNTFDTLKDYLWIATVSSPINGIATGTPSGFTDLITVQGSSLIYYTASISTCRKQDNTTYRTDPGPFTAPNCSWSGLLLRIWPDPNFPNYIPPVTSEGVGTYIYQKEASEVPVPFIDVMPVDQKYNADQTPTSDNPYGYYIEVDSSGSWTATWNTGTYFTASALSGAEGVTYITINCVNVNGSAGSYTDTLVFDGPGISTDSVNVEQYNV